MMNILLYLGTGLGANLGARIRAYIGTNLAHLGAGIRIRTRATMRGMTGQRLARLPLALATLATLASTAPRMLSTGAARGVHSLLPLLACLLLVACGGGGGGGGGGGATALNPATNLRTSYNLPLSNVGENDPAVVTAKANAIEASAFFTIEVPAGEQPTNNDSYGDCKYCGTDSNSTSDVSKAACYDLIGQDNSAYGFVGVDFDLEASGVAAGAQTNNIPLFLGAVADTDAVTPEVTNTTSLWGGWMEQSFFTAVSWQEDRDGTDDDLHHFGGYAVGNPSNTNPAAISGETLTWTGAMVGYGHSNARFNHRVRGQARVTVDSQSLVDVAFTNIFDFDATPGQSSNLPREDFPGMTMTQGTFNDEGIRNDPQNDPKHLYGRFYGPNHEEVAGYFGTDEIIGAFGAQQQP